MIVETTDRVAVHSCDALSPASRVSLRRKAPGGPWMLAIDKVGKTYPNGVRALDGVTFAVAPGEILAVVGGSGCGKSTLLRVVSGLDQPSQGAVRLDGDHITAPHE